MLYSELPLMPEAKNVSRPMSGEMTGETIEKSNNHHPQSTFDEISPSLQTEKCIQMKMSSIGREKLDLYEMKQEHSPLIDRLSAMAEAAVHVMEEDQKTSTHTNSTLESTLRDTSRYKVEKSDPMNEIERHVAVPPNKRVSYVIEQTKEEQNFIGVSPTDTMTNHSGMHLQVAPSPQYSKYGQVPPYSHKKTSHGHASEYHMVPYSPSIPPPHLPTRGPYPHFPHHGYYLHPMPHFYSPIPHYDPYQHRNPYTHTGIPPQEVPDEEERNMAKIPKELSYSQKHVPLKKRIFHESTCKQNNNEFDVKDSLSKIKSININDSHDDSNEKSMKKKKIGLKESYEESVESSHDGVMNLNKDNVNSSADAVTTSPPGVNSAVECSKTSNDSVDSNTSYKVCKLDSNETSNDTDAITKKIESPRTVSDTRGRLIEKKTILKEAVTHHQPRSTPSIHLRSGWNNPKNFYHPEYSDANPHSHLSRNYSPNWRAFQPNKPDFSSTSVYSPFPGINHPPPYQRPELYGFPPRGRPNWSHESHSPCPSPQGLSYHIPFNIGRYAPTKSYKNQPIEPIITNVEVVVGNDKQILMEACVTIPKATNGTVMYNSVDVESPPSFDIRNGKDEKLEGIQNNGPCIPIDGSKLVNYISTRKIDESDQVVLPSFYKLVNFPQFLPQRSPSNCLESDHEIQHRVNSDNRQCVMCGSSCYFVGNIGSKTFSGSERTRAISNVHNIIPRQNKGLCISCDVKVWLVRDLNLTIKWCKGCKNFRQWSAFGQKSRATKCSKCRERQKEKYATQKECLRLKRKIPNGTKMLLEGRSDSDESYEQLNKREGKASDDEIDAALGLSKMMNGHVRI